MPNQISALIIAKNESDNIAECIKSIAFCDEVIVIDDQSTDNTQEIAQDAGAIVYSHSMNGDYGAQQTFAISKAQYPWLLLIDCDERITSQLAQEIQQVVKRAKPKAYLIKRLSFFSGQCVRYGSMRPDYVCRLLPRLGTTVVGKVHQEIQHSYPEEKLKHNMLHYTYRSWDEYYNKFEKYTRLSAEKYQLANKKCHFFTDLILRPNWAFFKMYIIHRGFLDGKLGLVLAINHAFYTYTKYVRLYFLQHPLDKR